MLKKLDKKLQSPRDSLCSKERDCFRKVAAKKTTTFLHVYKFLKNGYCLDNDWINFPHHLILLCINEG